MLMDSGIWILDIDSQHCLLVCSPRPPFVCLFFLQKSVAGRGFFVFLLLLLFLGKGGGGHGWIQDFPKEGAMAAWPLIIIVFAQLGIAT